MSSEKLENKRDSTLILFDIDGTLTIPQKKIDIEFHNCLMTLKKRYSVGLVGGSDMPKITKQILPQPLDDNIDPFQFTIDHYDYVFAENGVVAYKDGKLICEKNIVDYIGKEKLNPFLEDCASYIETLQFPFPKYDNKIDKRKGMFNISPVGRDCSQEIREEFNAYDKVHNIREKFIDYLKNKYGPSGEGLDLVYAIGGQISFDVFPTGWDKRFCLDLIDKSFKEIHFFGDKTYPGGNDYEIFSDPRTIGHSVKDPSHTLDLVKKMFF